MRATEYILLDETAFLQNKRIKLGKPGRAALAPKGLQEDGEEKAEMRVNILSLCVIILF